MAESVFLPKTEVVTQVAAAVPDTVMATKLEYRWSVTGEKRGPFTFLRQGAGISARPLPCSPSTATAPQALKIAGRPCPVADNPQRIVAP